MLVIRKKQNDPRPDPPKMVDALIGFHYHSWESDLAEAKKAELESLDLGNHYTYTVEDIGGDD